MFFNWKWKKRLDLLFSSRNNLSKKDFIKTMEDKGYDKMYSLLIYNSICDYLPNSVNKNIYPSDNVIVDYDIDNEDLGDILIGIFEKINISFPNTEDQYKFYKDYGSNITIERLIQFLTFFGNVSN